MLVLSRRPKESIVIGDNVEVVVLDVQGEQVKIGIKAPRSVKVFRKEIFTAIQKSNIEAAAQVPVNIDDISKMITSKTNVKETDD